MNYTLTNNLGEEKECISLKELQELLKQPFSYWQQGSGDSAIQINSQESLIFFKLKEGVFIMQHPDYLAPIITKASEGNLVHYVGGQPMNIPKKCICNDEIALEIFSNYITKHTLSNKYEWYDIYEI